MSEREFNQNTFQIVDTRRTPMPQDAVEMRQKRAAEMVALCKRYYEQGELPKNLSDVFGDNPQTNEIVAFVLDAFRGKMRKDGKTPLAVHSLMLGASAHQLGIKDPDVFSTALLHDIAEDTELGVKDVQSRFGDQVAARASTMTEERITGDRFDSIVNFVEKLKLGGPTIAKVELLDRRDDILDLGYLTERLREQGLAAETANTIRKKLGEKFAKCRWTIDSVTEQFGEEPEVVRLKNDFDAVYSLQKERWQIPEDVIQTDLQEYRVRQDTLES